MDLGARLAERRRERGGSLKVVADAAHISTAYLQKLERCEVKAPSPHVLRALANALEVPYGELMALAGYLDTAASGVDRSRIERAIREILDAIGEDPDRDGLQRTPGRVADMYAEILRGLHDTTDQHLSVTFAADHDEMVMVKDIALYSVCEHHLVPFVGKAAVAYIPNENGRITGLSKLVRLVESFSRRLQVQERLTAQIADEIERSLQPRGVLVVVEAEHLCISMRGVKKPGAIAKTSAVHGLFRDDARTRAEALAFIHRR